MGPVFLLGLLGITFYLGSRPWRSLSRRGLSPKGIRDRNTNRDAVGVSSSDATVLSTTNFGIETPEQETSTSTIINIDSNIAKDLNVTNIVPMVSSMSDKDGDYDVPPSRKGTLTRRRSVRRIWKDGPGGDADSEQVGEIMSMYERKTYIYIYWQIKHFALSWSSSGKAA